MLAVSLLDSVKRALDTFFHTSKKKIFKEPAVEKILSFDLKLRFLDVLFLYCFTTEDMIAVAILS